MKLVSTRCQILRLKCTKIDTGWGSSSDHAGKLTALPRYTSWNKEDLLLRERERYKEGKGR